MSINEHYIAYMDVLGYKAFFKEHPNEVQTFHDRIDEAINRTVRQIGLVNEIAEKREYVLRKFIWSMAYHNYICDMKKKFKIHFCTANRTIVEQK